MHPLPSDDALRLGGSAYQSDQEFRPAPQFRERNDKTTADCARHCDLDAKKPDASGFVQPCEPAQ